MTRVFGQICYIAAPAISSTSFENRPAPAKFQGTILVFDGPMR
jgi:hypothetical protein